MIASARARLAALLFVVAFSMPGCSTQNNDAALTQKVDSVFAAFDKPDSPGCALGVVRDGNFIYKRGYGEGSLELGVPLTPESVFYMGSVSKQFTAASVVLAAEQGYLSLDDDIRKWVPEIPNYGKTITLREMLHHTSGFRDILGLLALSGRNSEDIHPTPELLDLLAHQKALNYAPGDEFLYSNTNYFLMSVVIPRATGKPFSQFAEENIFKPLGMSHTRFYDDRSVVLPNRVAAYEPRASGGFRVDWSTSFDMVGGGGLMSSVDDLLLWDRNFYDNKLGKGTLLKEMQTPGVLNNGKQIEYALGLFITKYRGLPIVEHGGANFGYRTELLRFPQQKFSVITLCNLGTSAPRNLANQVADIYLAGVFPASTNGNGDGATTTAQHVDAQRFAGSYRSPQSHSVYALSVSNGDLVLLGQHLKTIGANQFVFPGGPELRFESGAGNAMRFTFASEDAEPQVFERYQAIQLTAAEAAQYAGSFESSELEATYRIEVKDGKLILRMNWEQPATLEPTVRDEFKGPVGETLVFRRDAKGQIIGFDVFAGRVRNIYFSKTSK
jgi:CubicO group peptidase (beta-lactamase class C family)